MKKFSSQFIDRGSTLFLRLAIYAMGIAVTGLCSYFFYISVIARDVGAYSPVLLGMCVAAIPFFFGLYQALKLLRYIDRNVAFSVLSVQALRKIKFSAIAISALYAAGMPYIYYVAEKDDAPGVILIGLVLVAAPMVVAVFAEILLKLLQSAINLKSENDLTV